MEKTLIYDRVTICHEDFPVLVNASLSVERGELVYITGPVGSGKTSLLKSIFGEVTVQYGYAEVLGYDMLMTRANQLPELRRQLGLVHQDLKLLPDRTINENLDFVLRATDWKDKDRRQARIDELLEWVGLTEMKDHYPHELSGGQKQSICICRALLNRPKMILADEPTGHLDQENGERVIALLDEARRQYCCSVIIVTHNYQWPEDFPGTLYRVNNRQLERVN